MNKPLLIAAALAAASTAAPASAEVVGQIAAGYARVEYDSDWFDAPADIVALSGEVVFPASDLISFQLDGALARTEMEGYAETTTSGALHAFTRNDSYAVGAFVEMASTDGDAVWAGGVEAHKYFADATLAGSLAYGQYDDWADVDIWSLGGEARYFVNDDLRIDGRAGYVRIEDQSADFGGWTLGVGVERRFADQPFSVFAAYDHAESEDLGDGTADSFSVGLRWTFGSETLKQRDRKGASMGGSAPFAFFSVL